VGGVVRECLPPAAHEATPGDGGASMLRLGAEIWGDIGEIYRGDIGEI